jgi:hypothetical protein
MNIIEFIAQDVFDKVRGRFTNLEMGDEQGSITTNSKDARFFDFDFVIEGNNLGRVSVSINELGSLKVFYSQGITEDVDTITLNEWYEFLREMRYFAKRRMLRFDTRDITKSNLNKNDFQYLAQTGTKENNMNESAMIGRGPKTSMRKLENTRLIVRHSKAVDETQKGARSRNINALYIENADGERFKYPFIHLAGAKAMQRHVANGGRPYDDTGGQIINLSEKISQLVSFKRHVGHHDGMNQEVNEILDRSQMKLNELRKVIEGLAGQKYYEAWCETLQPNEDDGFVLDQATMEDYKDKFTQKNFKEDLTQYFPLIHTIMQETGEIDLTTIGQQTVEEISEEDTAIADEFTQFESWTRAVTEGTLEPDTIMALKDLINNGLSFGGPDATGAIEALQGIGVHNDELETALAAAAQLNPEGNPTDTILSWLMKDDPEAAAELGAGQQAQPVAQEPAMDPAAAPAPAAPVAPEQPVAEGPSPNKTEIAMAYLMAVVMAPMGTPEKRRILNWQQILDYKFDIEMDTAALAQMLPQFDSQLKSGKLDKLQNRMASRGELEIGESNQGVAEAAEDRTSYQVAKILFDKGIKYDSAKENDLISAIGMILVKELDMSPKQARYMINYDEDFVSDTLGELGNMGKEHNAAPEEGEDMENAESKPEGRSPSMKEIVEFIKPFYNKHAAEQGLGEWRKGPTELGIMAGKQFGDHVGKLVEKYVEEMQAKTEAMRGQQEATMQFEAIKKLAGLSK